MLRCDVCYALTIIKAHGLPQLPQNVCARMRVASFRCHAPTFAIFMTPAVSFDLLLFWAIVQCAGGCARES